RRVGLGRAARLAPRVVEIQDQLGIAREALRRRHIHHVDLGPDAVLVAEGGDAGFGRDAGAGQNDDALEARHAGQIPPACGSAGRQDLTGAGISCKSERCLCGERPMKTWLSWSSGKDSAWSLHVLREERRAEVAALFTTINAAFDRVAMHGVRRAVLE